MKKILLSVLVAFSSVVALAQPAVPCPEVSAVRKVNSVTNGTTGTCTAAISFFLSNDVSDPNPKGVQVEVFFGPVTGQAVLSQCFIAATPGSTHVTNSFTGACGSPVTIRITRFTASNGLCQGGSCGTIFTINESPLPVSFKSFSAARNRSNVGVKWETASEQNNSGFAVERNLSGTWEQVAFVPSQAANGNSNDVLSYQFTDLNNTKGITQYRIKQVDIDSKSKYSEIRSVRGDGQKGKTIIYPNPSTDGKVNVVFEETNVTRDISVTDMAGRTVKQMKGLTNNNITIENLNPGMYTLRVFVPATGDQTVEKIIVNKR